MQRGRVGRIAKRSRTLLNRGPFPTLLLLFLLSGDRRTLGVALHRLLQPPDLCFRLTLGSREIASTRVLGPAGSTAPRAVALCAAQGTDGLRGRGVTAVHSCRARVAREESGHELRTPNDEAVVPTSLPCHATRSRLPVQRRHASGQRKNDDVRHATTVPRSPSSQPTTGADSCDTGEIAYSFRELQSVLRYVVARCSRRATFPVDLANTPSGRKRR